MIHDLGYLGVAVGVVVGVVLGALNHFVDETADTLWSAFKKGYDEAN